MTPSFFGAACWEALQAGACPGLEVLWVQAYNSQAQGWIAQTQAPPDVVRAALTAPGSALAASLKLLMVNPDMKRCVSRFDLDAARTVAAGGKLTAAQKNKADRLQGDKEVPIDYSRFGL